MMARGGLYAAALIAAVVAGVVLATLALDPPSIARARRFDEERVTRLKLIQAAVDAYVRTAKSLPADRAALLTEISYVGDSAFDPESGKPLTYVRRDDRHYQLCATFAIATDTESSRDTVWKHRAGPFCFERTVISP